MTHNILLTGASGYLGGSFLHALQSVGLPAYNLFAFVRSDAQAQAVRRYNATPLPIDLSNAEVVTSNLLTNKITIVYHLHDPLDRSTPVWIKALAAVKQQTGFKVHFLFTTGAKMFSSFSGAPTAPFSDADPGLYDIQKAQPANAAVAWMGTGVECNNLVIEAAEALGVRSYIFVPCIVYGRGRGFGNPVSIQTVAVVRAAKAVRRVYKPETERFTWPVCHVDDNTTLYIEILRGILEGKDIGHGKEGYYLASPGSVAWDDIYAAMAVALKKRGVVDDESVGMADAEVLERMGEGMYCPGEYVPTMIGGLCTLVPEHGKKIGWQPRYAPEHILDAADEEVGIILENLEGARRYVIPKGTPLRF